MKLITQNCHLWLFAKGAGACNRQWIAACALLTMATIYAAWFHPRQAHAEQAVALQGKAAVQQLKIDGRYDSLASAVTAARDQSIGVNNYTQQQKVNASDGEAKDQLGWSIALSGDTAAVGAPSDDIRVGNKSGFRLCLRSQRRSLDATTKTDRQ